MYAYICIYIYVYIFGGPPAIVGIKDNKYRGPLRFLLYHYYRVGGSSLYVYMYICINLNPCIWQIVKPMVFFWGPQ